MPTAISLIEENSLRITADGFQVKVRENWYRSLPLSCIEKVAVTLDGVQVSQEAVRFGVNGSLRTLQELEDLTTETWYVQDSAILHVRQPGKLSAGQTYTIEVEIILRAPYILVGPGKFLTLPTKHKSVQVAA
jgi:Domain of unknown function (DUF6379)